MYLFLALLTAAGIRTIHALLILPQFHNKGWEECFEAGSLVQLQRKALSYNIDFRGELCSQGFWDAVEPGNLTAGSQRDKSLTHSYLTKLTL